MRGRIDEPDRRLRTNTPLYALAGGRGSALAAVAAGRYPAGVIVPSRLVSRLGRLARVGSLVGWGGCPEPTCEP